MDEFTNQTIQNGHVQKQKTDETREIFTVRTTESQTDSASAASLEPQVTATTQERTLHTEDLHNPVHIEKEDTLRIQDKAREVYEKLNARYSMPVEQPVREPDGLKARRECSARIKRAKALTPAGDEYTTVIIDAVRQRKAILDMSTPDIEMEQYKDKARRNGIDERQLLTFMHKVTLDKAGKADPALLEKVKRENLRFIEDFSSGDRERQIPHLDRITEEMLRFKFSPGMFEPVRLAQNMPQLLEMSQYLTSLQDLRRQFPWYFESQPAFRRAMLDDLTELSTVFNTHLQNVMSSHAYDYAHNVMLQNTGPVMELCQMSEESFREALGVFMQKREEAMRAEADRLARNPEEEEITVINARPIGEGAYKYGVPSTAQVLEIIKKQSNLADTELNMLIESGRLKDVLDSASRFHDLLGSIGSASQGALFTDLLAEQRRFIDSAATLAAALKDDGSEVQRSIAAALGFMAMKTMSYSAVLVNLESEFRYNVAMGDERSLKTQMTDSGLGENYEGSHRREQYRTDLTDPDGLQIPVLSQNLRNTAGKEISDDRDFSAIVMTVEAYEDYLRSAQVPPCETEEDRNKYPERIEKLLGELLAFNDRITARSLGYVDKNARNQEKQALCNTLEKYVIGRDIEDNNFVRVAELAYRLRHNDFSDAGFNAAYTGKTIMEALQNTRIAKVDLNSSDYTRTGGSVSTVYIPQNTQTEQAVYRKGAAFRPGGEMNIDEIKGRISVYKTTKGRIIDAHKSSRDVAAARVDKLLGSGVIADASHVVYTADGEGQTVGTKMELAQDKEVMDYSVRTKRGDMVESRIGFQKIPELEGQENMYIDLSAPESLESVYWLQVVDVICGSVDRHVGNFFVRTDGHGVIKRITGIDNDMAFGENFMPMRTELDRLNMFGREIYNKTRIIDVFPVYSPVFDQAFPCIPSGIYDKVMALTPEALSKELRGSIRDSELQTAVLRLKALQEHFQNIPHYDLTDPGQAKECAQKTRQTAEKLASEYSFDRVDTVSGNYFAMMMKM